MTLDENIMIARADSDKFMALRRSFLPFGFSYEIGNKSRSLNPFPPVQGDKSLRYTGIICCLKVVFWRVDAVKSDSIRQQSNCLCVWLSLLRLLAVVNVWVSFCLHYIDPGHLNVLFCLYVYLVGLFFQKENVSCFLFLGHHEWVQVSPGYNIAKGEKWDVTRTSYVHIILLSKKCQHFSKLSVLLMW